MSMAAEVGVTMAPNGAQVAWGLEGEMAADTVVVTTNAGTSPMCTCP
jgi:hypothetical protein